MAAGGATPVLAGRRVLLGVSGGIAAYKAVLLLRLLVEAGAEVQVVMTPAATRFVGPDTFAALSRRPVHTDLFERPQEVLHVRLAREAELAAVAPATANLIARLALGLADDLLTATLLEATCPLVVAPAMHSGMWEHPATQENVRRLAARGAVVVGPATGPLAAGDEGAGRMAEPEEVLAALAEAARRREDLAGRRVLVTAGPTHEPLDAVRFLGNRSSGRMGFAVAAEAARRGAAVTLVTGPVTLPEPPGVEVVRVETAEEMAREVLARASGVDAVVMAAAVADWRPQEVAPGKLKKEAGPPRVELEPTTDVLATLGKRKQRQVLVGFAAETVSGPALEAEGRRKLAEKDLDLVVANEVGRPGTGFGAETNVAAILSRDGADVPAREWTKAELAREVCDRLALLLRGAG
ncbi:MAG TPA: bifunctional phosphopantothenoylcysteine decarboxylase/phosphopantothenate--cysteine ligase CoaBC [Actinomycetota bacterium]|nr:bifunctional phosphopantothenoylcysteine decarboxylase/phosphopantothenate--cysteine ligase CoaBC [Actinomycetota bacterium]